MEKIQEKDLEKLVDFDAGEIKTSLLIEPYIPDIDDVVWCNSKITAEYTFLFAEVDDFE